jgi:hypothetical protein
VTAEPATPPWLSVLVPAFDAAPHVEAMLRSVLVQGDDGVEVVVVDDASRDDTAARVRRVAERDARVRFTANPDNTGVAHVRRQLLDAARGGYVWFVDADDVVADGALESLHALLREDPVDLVLCDFRTLHAAPWRRRRRSTFSGPAAGDDRDVLLAGALEAAQLHVWSRIARRTLWQAVDFPSRARYEDMPAVAQLLSMAARWRHVAQPWIGYRQRAGSLSRAVPVDALADHAAALAEVRACLAPHAHSARARHALDYLLLRGHAAIARRLHRAGCADGDVAEVCHAAFLRDLPDAGADALAQCRRRGWWLRAARIATALDRVGWRSDAG